MTVSTAASARGSRLRGIRISITEILGSIFSHGQTVIRGGYSRIYGRLNGVPLVLTPLLGTGLLQPVSCIGASRTGQCLGNGGVDPTTAFRIGADGMTAPLPSISQTL